MNRKFSRLAAPALAVGLCLSLGAGVSATQADATITASYRNIQLMINGANYTPTDTEGNVVPLFIYNGTTYGPVRAVCEAFGYNVDFDTATNTVIVGAKLEPRESTAEAPDLSEDQQIEIAYRDVTIKVGGQTITPTDEAGNAVEPFIYNGTTYIPVRAVANALGQEVVWNSESNTIQIGLQPVEFLSTPTTAVPVNSWQRMLVNDGENAYIAKVRVTSVYSGATAANMMFSASMKNKPLMGDKQYLVAKVAVTVEKTADGEPVALTSDLFRAFNTQKQEYEPQNIVVPKPEFGGTAREGQTLTGTIAFVIKGSDTSPRIVFGGAEEGDGGLWFRATRG